MRILPNPGIIFVTRFAFVQQNQASWDIMFPSKAVLITKQRSLWQGGRKTFQYENILFFKTIMCHLQRALWSFAYATRDTCINLILYWTLLFSPLVQAGLIQNETRTKTLVKTKLINIELGERRIAVILMAEKYSVSVSKNSKSLLCTLCGVKAFYPQALYIVWMQRTYQEALQEGNIYINSCCENICNLKAFTRETGPTHIHKCNCFDLSSTTRYNRFWTSFCEKKNLAKVGVVFSKLYTWLPILGNLVETSMSILS